MGLNKSDMRIIEGKIEEIGRKLIAEGGRRAKDKTTLTKKRLYAYPLLQDNIRRYKLDIEDIKRETFGKSKSIVIFQRNSGAGEKPTLEDKRAARIYMLEQKIARDEAEIKEMDAALSTIRDDEYFCVVEMTFFQREGIDKIAENLRCDKATIWRNIGRLIDTLNVVLYGAEAL